jgi:phosphoglycerate dehydrogenase-like enzyme
VASDVVVTNMRGIFNDHISAHILAIVLAFARGLPRYWTQQARREWATGAPTFYLPECTAVILGVGGIGAETARLCAEFGMRVIGVDPRVESPPTGVAELVRPERMNDVLPRGDFVIVTVPETPATRGMFDSAFFARMKQGAVFINIGRGATVKLADLDAALRSGHLAGAGLDVFEREPLPADHPLWDAPGMLITPHVAADGPYLDDRRAEVFLDNCRRFHDGRPLRNVVDKANWF